MGHGSPLCESAKATGSVEKIDFSPFLSLFLFFTGNRVTPTNKFVPAQSHATSSESGRLMWDRAQSRNRPALKAFAADNVTTGCGRRMAVVEKKRRRGEGAGGGAKVARLNGNELRRRPRRAMSVSALILVIPIHNS